MDASQPLSGVGMWFAMKVPEVLVPAVYLLDSNFGWVALVFAVYGIILLLQAWFPECCAGDEYAKGRCEGIVGGWRD